MLGDHLRAAREKAKLSQEKVAAVARISREYVSQIEGGKKSPTFNVLVRICWAIGVDIGEIARNAEREMRPSNKRR